MHMIQGCLQKDRHLSSRDSCGSSSIPNVSATSCMRKDLERVSRLSSFSGVFSTRPPFRMSFWKRIIHPLGRCWINLDFFFQSEFSSVLSKSSLSCSAWMSFMDGVMLMVRLTPLYLTLLILYTHKLGHMPSFTAYCYVPHNLPTNQRRLTCQIPPSAPHYSLPRGDFWWDCVVVDA